METESGYICPEYRNSKEWFQTLAFLIFEPTFFFRLHAVAPRNVASEEEFKKGNINEPKIYIYELWITLLTLYLDI